MSLLTTIGFGVGFAILGIVGYAIACTAVLSLIRLPEEGPLVIVEDLLFVATLPFVAFIVLLPALRR